MSPVNRTRTILAALAIGAALTACSTSTGPSSEDTTYLEALKDQNISLSDDALIDLGHKACDDLKGGENMIGLGMKLDRENDDLDAGQAGAVLGASMGTYCVDFTADTFKDAN